MSRSTRLRIWLTLVGALFFQAGVVAAVVGCWSANDAARWAGTALITIVFGALLVVIAVAP